MHLRVAVALSMLLSVAGLAQIPQSSPAVTAASNQTIGLQFPNSDVKEVLALYERLTNKKLVFDASVQGNVNIFITSKVTPDEAIRIIETTLLLNGYSLVPGQGDIVKVIGLAKNPRQTGIPIYSDLELLPEGERVVSFLFKLQYADPQELAQVLQTGYVAGSIYTAMVPLPKSSALLVTESTAVIRGLERIIHELDVPPAEVVSEFITLERADVKDVIEKLEKIFDKQQTPAAGAGGAPGAPRIVRTNPPGNPDAPVSLEVQGGTLSEDSIIVGKIKLTADVRTNRIHVVTRPINLPFVRKLIHEFDSNIPFGEPKKRPLKYISASEVLDIVVKAITEPGAKAEDSGAAGGAGGKAPGGTAAGGNSFGSSFGGGNNSSSGSGGGSLNFSEGLSTQPVDTTPKAVTVGNTKIIADPRENTIIVLGSKEIQQKVFALLDQIDVRAPQVLLNTVIGEMTLSQDRRVGFNYFLGNSGVNGATTSGTGGGIGSGGRNGIVLGSNGTPALDLASLLSTRNMKNATALFTGGATGLQGFVAASDSLGVLVDALESTGRFRVTQRPMVFTSNNKKAIIASGQEIAVPTQTQSTVVDNTGNAINNNVALNSNIQFKTVALQLEVVPLINSDREVALDILQKVDDVSGTTRVGGNDIPNISTRYIKTNVSVPNRATVLLGGLIRSRTDKSDSGVPYLSRVPLLGFFFKSNSKTTSRSELIVLIQPIVSTNPHEQIDHSDVEQKRLMIEPDIAATIGAPAPTPETQVKFRTETTTYK